MALIERKKCELFHIDEEIKKIKKEKKKYHNLYTVTWKKCDQCFGAFGTSSFLICQCVSEEYKNKDHCSFFRQGLLFDDTKHPSHPTSACNTSW